jgi:ferredoxin
MAAWVHARLDAPMTPPATLTILPLGTTVPVAPGQSLLEAALAAGVSLPRSCRNGTCRACRCQMLSGAVRYRIDWPGLSPDEREAGEILPCVALPGTDVGETGEAVNIVIEAPLAQRLPPSPST